ncbi:MAG: hypothetical protein AAF515_22915 [Pseudomonadota bacterium]
MEYVLRLLLSPAAFAIGFLWPLAVQVLQRAELMTPGPSVWLVGALIVLPFTLMAHFRGSWIWLR